MPVTRRWAYFSHAALAPLPDRTRRAIAQWAADASQGGAAIWRDWQLRVEECRALAARMLGADLAEIALVPNTTAGISLVAEGYPWQAGDNVVVPAGEFPSNQYPWLQLAARGVETRRVPTDDAGRLDLNRLEAACDARTRIVAVSWVDYLTGWRCDLRAVAEMVHRRGALLLVDAIQGAGVFPLDVHAADVDFLAADGHKWMLGPEGAGLFYLKRAHLDLLRPIGPGWHSVVHAADFGRIELTLKPSAARYEGGTQNMVGFLGLAESLELLAEFGQPALQARILELTDLACDRLADAGAVLRSPREGEHRSGIVSFELPGRDALAAKRQLLAASVDVSARGDKIRIAAHAYNDETDIDRLIEALLD